MKFQLFGIFLFDLETANILGNIVASQWNDGKVAQHIVLVYRYGCGICTKINECTSGTFLASGQYCIGCSQWRKQVFGYFVSSLAETLADIALQGVAAYDIQKVSFYAVCLDTNRFGCKLVVPDFIFLRFDSQNLLIHQGNVSVIFHHGINQSLGYFGFFRQLFCFCIPNTSYRLSSDTYIYLLDGCV